MSEAEAGGDIGARDSLVEEFGIHIGRAMGWPPLAGRAAGLLMMSDEPLTLTQLQSALEASKGSASETTRLLIANGTVERYKAPGQRHFVYRWRDDAWVGCLQHVVDSMTQLRDLAERAQGQAAAVPQVQRERLGDMREYYGFMVHSLESLLAEYVRTQEARPRGPVA
ncbi:hypothetical protein DSC45_04480 [Streptomyces sp. YIM 130001]|uniref:GbsR/MarR family transcriptional regulator n=1 Tax=Streptomyces sp. YIM 130001 TaxID=2259644 RepID=UPI000E65ABBC|nr:hypothetical protein [Streptomyces sp. YIM 130001]RII20462.1 hypothetical protein DSC45_04480 [Streptomyces sp. YIM 130001]